jgi:hypothetical protein
MEREDTANPTPPLSLTAGKHLFGREKGVDLIRLRAIRLDSGVSTQTELFDISLRQCTKHVFHTTSTVERRHQIKPFTMVDTRTGPSHSGKGSEGLTSKTSSCRFEFGRKGHTVSLVTSHSSFLDVLRTPLRHFAGIYMFQIYPAGPIWISIADNAQNMIGPEYETSAGTIIFNGNRRDRKAGGNEKHITSKRRAEPSTRRAALTSEAARTCTII